MDRVTIDMPDTFSFTTRIDIRISDIIYDQHVGHDALVSILHEARVRYLNNLGFTETDVAGNGMIMTDLTVVYKGQTFYGEQLDIQIAAENFTRNGYTLFYRVTRAGSPHPVLEARTRLLFYNYEVGKVVPVPDSFLSRAK